MPASVQHPTAVQQGVDIGKALLRTALPVADDLRPAFKMLSRVARIQAQLLQSWEVLATMTPADYAAFRDALGEASGFQSFQYRIAEYTLGNKNAALAEVFRHAPDIHNRVQAALHAPSLYDETLRLLRRRDFAIGSVGGSRC